MAAELAYVATQITREENRALFLHCFTHSFNLAVSDTMKNSTVCQAALETAFEVSKLVNYSPKREAAFDHIKSSNEENSFACSVRSFCPTHWRVRGDSIESIIDNYQVLQQLWDKCLEGNMAPEVKGRIIGVKEQMSRYHIVFGLWLSCRVMKITDNLSRTLQTQSISAAESYGLAKMTCSTLQGMRTDDKFSLFFQRVELFRQQVGVEEPSLPRKRRRPQCYETGDVQPHYSDTVQDHYRKIYFEVIDLAVNSISSCFEQPGYAKYTKLESLLLKAASKEG